MAPQPFHQFSDCFQFKGFVFTGLCSSGRHSPYQTGEIIGCRTNCPGSWHDSRVAEGIYEKLEHETPDGYCLVADTAFPTGHNRISGKILVPLKAGVNLPHDPTHISKTVRTLEIFEVAKVPKVPKVSYRFRRSSKIERVRKTHLK